ncbi:MAG: choice-of-anchor D domain-containing protein [Bdellovibrionia bacterium]
MKRNRLSTITLLSSSLFALNSWAASDIYVAPSGNDSNAGTQSSPFLTIAKASKVAAPGTTIHVAAGTYKVSAPGINDVGILTTMSGTSAAHIRFVSDPKNRAKIVLSGTGFAWDNKGNYVDIDGFEISGSGRGGILSEAAHVSITNNYIHDLTVSGGCNGNGGAGIDTYTSVGDVVITNNIVRNIGYPSASPCNGIQGIYIASVGNIVMNNVVSNIAAVGIHQWHGATASAIINNTVFNNKEGILIGNGDGGALPNGSENNYVANNIVYDNRAYGIIEYGKVGANNRYINNLVYDSGTNVKMISGSISGTISQDPMFVKYEADGTGDYHLQPSSPAIGKGTLTSAPLTDFDGKPRGSSIDIGAYEYAAVSAPAPSPSPTVTPKPSPSPSPTPAKRPAASLSASALAFSWQKVGTTSKVQLVKITNTGNANLIFSNFSISGDFAFGGTGTCVAGRAYAPGASCTASVVFKPKASGTRAGVLSIPSNASSTPAKVSLSGRGY